MSEPAPDDRRYARGLAYLIASLARAASDNLRPPPKLSLSAWAHRHAVLSRETSAQTGRFRAFPYQTGMMDAVTDPAVTSITVMKSARVGYALALDTPLPTPTGWTTMGAVQIGDRLLDQTGTPCKVTCKSPVFDDHQCFRVRFCDGSEVIADAGHRWYVEADRSFEYLRGQRGTGRVGRPKPGQLSTCVGVIDTSEMAQMIKSNRGRTMLAIPNSMALQLPDVDLPIPPYTLGLWLGDGHAVTPRITQHRSDVETADYVAEEGIRASVRYIDARYPNNATIFMDVPDTGRPVSPWAAKLRRAGVLGKKHIPAIYLRASITQRLALLRGLMDSDGTISAKGFAEFCNTNETLARGVYELAVSLGLKASLAERPPQRAQCLKQYRVVFKPLPELNPFRLRRKADRVRTPSKPSITKRRRVVLVERVPSVRVQCVEVDSPSHLFLCGWAMIPTHNTKVLDHIVGYYLHQDPSPVMVVQPRVEDAEDYSKSEIAPMLRDTPVLSAIAGDPKAKDSGQTILKKTFSNGSSLAMVGANSPGGFRRITVRIACFDEVDGYPINGAGNEGDQVALGSKRTETFWNRKIIIGSTPTIKGYSRVEKSWENSDQRRFWVPCPHCGSFQVLEWGGPDLPYGMKWEKDAAGVGLPETAYYVCRANSCVIHDADKPEMVAAGQWRAAKPFKGHAGFHVWAGYSLFPNACWANLVAEWLRVKDDPLARQTFINLVLGEPYEDRGDKALAESRLASRCEVWAAEVPDGVAAVTAGLDVQDDRVEVEVVGWGRNEESWSIAHEVIEGDPGEPKLWDAVDAFLKRIWHRGDGRGFEVMAACIDSGGHHTQRVYDFAKARLGRKIWAIKGESARAGQRSPVWPTKRPSARNKASFRPVIIGVNAAKDVIRARLHLEAAGPGYMHFPVDRDINYFAQLTSERLITKLANGQKYRVWELPGGRANEALDCRVYAYAALCGLLHFGLKLNRRAEEVTTTIGPSIDRTQEQPAAQVAGPRITKPETIPRSLANRLA